MLEELISVHIEPCQDNISKWVDWYLQNQEADTCKPLPQELHVRRHFVCPTDEDANHE
jgi:hypothetical protein